MFELNFKLALRSLWKRKLFALINILGLGLGLGSCMMLLLYVNYEWSYDKQFKNIDHIYGVAKNVSNGSYYNATLGPFTNALPNALVPKALETMPGLKYASRMVWGNQLLNYKQHSLNVSALFADPSFLNIFNYQFIKGDPATALSDVNSILITASTAKKLFANADPIGKIIKWDNREGLTVTAVIADLPPNQTIQFEALLSWSFFLKENNWARKLVWSSGYCNVVMQLKDELSFSAADAVLRKMIIGQQKDDKYTVPFLLPFSKVHLYNTFDNGIASGGKITQVKLLLLLAFCILLIACINYMNLSTAQSENRAKEVGVRKTLGSTRKGIVAQFMIESMILSFLAMGIAFILVELFLPYFNNLLESHIVVDYTSFTNWLVLVGLILLTGLLAGSYPSFYLSSFVPARVLKGSRYIGKSSMSIRQVLVVFQFSCSVCMIICAIVIFSQIRYVQNKPLGFDQNNLIQLDQNGELRKPEKLSRFKTELIRSGAISSITAYSTSLTAGADNSSDIHWERNSENNVHSFNIRTSGYDLLKTLGIQLQSGRDFSPRFSSDSSAVLLNESAVKLMQLENPIGTKIVNYGKSFTVIGVLKDYAYESAAVKVKPTLTFLPDPSVRRQTKVLFLRLNPAQNLSISIQQIKAVAGQINPIYPAEMVFTDQLIADKLADEKLLSMLANLSGGFAIFISSLGLMGLALYMAEQRKKEISVRRVLGADLKQILILLNRDFIKLVLLANLIAAPIAYIIAYKWLQKYDYSTDLTCWPMFITFSLSILISIITVSFQILQTARTNVASVLKSD